MKEILVDSNIILDVVTEDYNWFEWSASKLAEYVEKTTLIINLIIYAEVSIGFARIEELEVVLPAKFFCRANLRWEAAFLAGKCFQQYRRRGGTRRSLLPDFCIGDHAVTDNMILLTRDINRYQTYFPTLELITPESSP